VEVVSRRQTRFLGLDFGDVALMRLIGVGSVPSPLETRGPAGRNGESKKSEAVKDGAKSGGGGAGKQGL